MKNRLDNDDDPSLPCLGPCFSPPPLNTKAHFILEEKYFTKKEYHMNVNAYGIVYTAVLTLQAKNDPDFSILLSKIHAWNKLKLYKMCELM